MAASTATIANNTHGDPEVGQEVAIKTKHSTHRRRRALIGWNHQDDSLNGLEHGQIWCWVSAGNHLQIFDATCNRSSRPGQVVFCGVANFTMVRMFHPFWCNHGRIPKDMVSSDKERCRENYRRLMRRWQARNGLPDDDEPDSSDEPDEPPNPDTREVRRKPAGRGRGRPRGSRGGRGGRRGRVLRGRVFRQTVTGTEANVPGSAADDAMEISEAEGGCDFDSDNDLSSSSSSDAMTGESDNDDQRPRAKRLLSRAVSDDCMMGDPEDVRNSDIESITAKQEDANEVKREEEDIIEVVDLTSDTDIEDDAKNDTTTAAITDVNFDRLTESTASVTVDAAADPNADTVVNAGANYEDDSDMFVDQGIGEDFTIFDEGYSARVKTEEETREATRVHEEVESRMVATVRHMVGPREYISIDDD